MPRTSAARAMRSSSVPRQRARSTWGISVKAAGTASEATTGGIRVWEVEESALPHSDDLQHSDGVRGRGPAVAGGDRSAGELGHVPTQRHGPGVAGGTWTR